MKKNDGGSAFPVDAPVEPCMVKNPGMSLRDYFAGQALLSLVDLSRFPTLEEEMRTAAQHAYRYADAMLEARDKE